MNLVKLEIRKSFLFLSTIKKTLGHFFLEAFKAKEIPPKHIVWGLKSMTQNKEILMWPHIKYFRSLWHELDMYSNVEMKFATDAATWGLAWMRTCIWSPC